MFLFTFQVLEGGSQKGKDLLVDNRGHLHQEEGVQADNFLVLFGP